MNHDEQDELWNLLGKARAPKERPFFASKVLLEIEQTPRAGEVSIWLVIRRWLAPVAAGACAAAVAVFALRDTPEAMPGPAFGGAIAQSADPLSEFATVVAESDELDATIEGLLAADNNSVWLYADPSSLY